MLWYQDLVEQAAAGSHQVMVLDGNVHDPVKPGSITGTFDVLGSVFGQSLAERCPADHLVAARYSQTSGLQFLQPDVDMERFTEMCEGTMQQGGMLPPDLESLKPEVLVVLLNHILAHSEGLLLVIDHADLIWGANSIRAQSMLEAILEWATHSRYQYTMTEAGTARPRRNWVVLLTEDRALLHDRLKGLYHVNRPLPDETERGQQYRQILERVQRSRPEFQTEIDEPTFARVSSGLNNTDIANMVWDAALSKHPLDRVWLREKKRRRIGDRYHDVLDARDPSFGYEQIGGLEPLKEYFLNVARKYERGQGRFNQAGCLLIGPPGTSKTRIIEAAAFEMGWQFAQLVPDKIRGSLVGESERRLAAAFRGVENMRPCMLVIEEVDRFLQPGQAGDSGVGQTQFNMVLDWLAREDHPAKGIFKVATTNHPETLLDELVRPGRLSVMVPVLPPPPGQLGAAERWDIIKAIATNQLGYQLVVDDAFGVPLAANISTYTGSEIRGALQCIPDFDRLHFPEVNADDLRQAFEMTKPAVRDLEGVCARCIDMCRFEPLKPAGWLEYFQNQRVAQAPLGTAHLDRS